MGFSKTIRKILGDACVYFTCAEFVLLAVAAVWNSTSPESGGGVVPFLSLSAAAWILLACVLISALNPIFRLDLSFAIQMTLHFIGSLTAFGIVFIIIPKVWSDFGAIFVRLGIFTVLYLTVAFVMMIVRSIRQNRRTDDLEYESQFGEFFTDKEKKGKNS